MNLTAALFSSTAYERPLLLQICHEAGVGQVVESDAQARDADLQWGKARDLVWEPILDGKCVGGCHPVFSVLTRKADLARCLNSTPAGRALIPETLVIDDDSDSEDEEGRNEGDNGYPSRLAAPGSRMPRMRIFMGRLPPEHLWVLKASDSNRGENIFFVRGTEEGASKVEEATGGSNGPGGSWVLQEYVQQLLLLGGRKFHLRVHVVAAGSLVVGVHRHTLVLPASLPFSASSESLENGLVHTTNACQQRSAGAYGAGSCLLSEAAETWHLEAQQQQQQQQHKEEENGEGRSKGKESWLAAGMLLGDSAALEPEEIIQVLEERIASAVRAVFDAAAGSPLGFFPLSNCFQLFGFDFLVDRSLNLSLLEINSDPSIGIFGERLKREAKELLSDTLRVGLRMATSSLSDAPSPGLDAAAQEEAPPSSGAPPQPWRGFETVLSRPSTRKAAAGRGIVKRLLLQCGLLSASGPRLQGRTEGSPSLAAISSGAYGSEAATEVIGAVLGWETTSDARMPLVRLQWAAHKDVRWERVMDGSLAANHYFARRALAAPSCAAQLYLAITQLLQQQQQQHEQQRPGGSAPQPQHPMPLTLAPSSATDRREWQLRIEQALEEGHPEGHPRSSLWYACAPGVQPWRLQGGQQPPVAWEEALDAAFGHEEAASEPPVRSPGPTWLLQRALPGSNRGPSSGYVARGVLLLAGASTAFLHRRLRVLHQTEEKGHEGRTEAAETEDVGEEVFCAARSAAATMAAAAWSFNKQTGFMPLPNCFELFWVHFWVDASASPVRAWLLSCESPSGAADDAVTANDEQLCEEEAVVREALLVALPLVGISQDTAAAPGAEASPLASISDNIGGFAEIYRHGPPPVISASSDDAICPE